MTAQSPTDPLRRRRLEPDARREQILQCAIRLFGERPYAAVSTIDIAREAGIARGLLNHYFGTKRDLYLEVVRQMVLPEEVDLVVPDGATLDERVDICVDWFLDAVGEHGKTFVAVTGAEGVGDDPEIEKIMFEADNVAAQRVLEAMGLADSPHNEQAARGHPGLRRDGQGCGARVGPARLVESLGSQGAARRDPADDSGRGVPPDRGVLPRPARRRTAR